MKSTFAKNDARSCDFLRPRIVHTFIVSFLEARSTIRVNRNRSLFVATRVKKQTKNKVKDLTSKLGTRMETGRLRRDLLGLRVEQPPGLLFNDLI